jgi:TolB-like protein
VREKLLEINLFGACAVRSTRAGGFELVGSKHRALFALLATAPYGRRTRAFLQDTLWGTACYDSGRQSLRRALSDIKHVMGDAFHALLAVNNAEITLDLSQVVFIGQPGRGEFLEGIDLKEDGFNEWLRGIRLNPEQIYGLYSLTTQPPSAPNLPAITILPFRLAVGDASYNLLGDWVAEEICRSLSRSNLLAVISHLSSREIARRQIEVGLFRSTLGVDYCVTGSLRVLDEKVIVDADFLDAASGRILWTRQFGGSVGDFLSQSAGGIGDIVSAIGRTIADEAMAHVRGREVTSLADRDLLVAGVSLMHRATLSSFAKSRELIEETIRRAPLSAEAHAWLGKWYTLSVYNSWSTDRARGIQNALDCTARSLDINPENSFALTIDGFAQTMLLRELDVAEKRYDDALGRNPNEALSWLLLGALHAFTDDPKQAVGFVERARRLSPLDPFGYFYDSLSATAYFADEKYSLALELAEKSLRENDRHLSTQRVKICALHHLGMEQEARAAGAELMRRQPDFSVSKYQHEHPAAGFKLGQDVARALRAAGIP